MITLGKIFLFGLVVTWASPQLAESAELTCANKKTRQDIDDLIGKWNEDSVVLNDRISTYAKIRGRSTGQEYRLDNERPTGDGFAKFRIQSGKATYGAILIRPGVNFGRNRIRSVFTESVARCRVEKLQ